MAKVPISSLIPYPGNARTHALDAIAGQLQTHGQYRPVVVQQSTGYVIAGNGTLEAARDRLGWDTIAVDYLDVDDDTALQMVLGDNHSQDLSTYDDAKLYALIGPLAAAGDLEGTGHTLDSVDDLLARLGGVPDMAAQPFTGGHAETDEEQQARADTLTDADDDEPLLKAKPLLLLFVGKDYARYTKLVAKLRTDDEPAAMTVLRALRAAVAAP